MKKQYNTEASPNPTEHPMERGEEEEFDDGSVEAYGAAPVRAVPENHSIIELLLGGVAERYYSPARCVVSLCASILWP